MKQLLAKCLCLIIFSVVLFISQVTAESSDPDKKDKGKILDIPTLGRPVMLGELYSARSDQFIPGFSLWQPHQIKSATNLIWHPSSHTDFSADSSTDKKNDDLNIGASLAGSFQAGLVKVSGSAEYLNNEADDEHTASVTMSYKSISRTETLSSSLTNNTDKTHCKFPIDKNSQPTHLVFSVTYGGNAHFVFSTTVSETEDKTVITGNISVFVKGGTFEIEGSAHLNISDYSRDFTDDLTVKMYSDFILEKQPLTFKDTKKIYRDISSNFGSKDSLYNQSVPMSMVLIPLEVFCDNGGLAAKIAEDILKRATGVRLTLLKVLDKIAKLLDSRVAVGNFEVRLLLLDFQSDVDNYTLSYEAELQEIIIVARNPDNPQFNQTELVGLINDDTKSNYSYAKYLYPYLTEKTRQVNAINIFYDQTVLQDEPQISVYSKADIPEALITEHLVFVLTLYVLPDVEAEKYSVYINQQKNATKTWLKDAWYNDRETVGDVGTAWRNFRTFFEINEYEDGRQYFVLLKQEETNKTIIMNLQLYVDGVNKTFQLAELMDLNVNSSIARAESNITITVDNPPAHLSSIIEHILVIVTKTPSDNLYSSTPTLFKVDIDKTSSTVITIPDLVPEYSYNVTVAYSTKYGSLTPSKVVTNIGKFYEMGETVGCKIEEDKKKINITIMKNSTSASDCANICHSEPKCTDGWTFELGVGNCYSNDAGSNSISMEGWAVGTQACGLEIVPSPTPPPTVSTPPSGCPAGWKEYQTKCYKGFAPLNWQQAEMACQKCEGHLASINSKGEDTFINNLGVNGPAYVGGFKIENWGLWTDGSTWNYTNWIPGQPSGDGNCMNLYSEGWNNVDCDAILPSYICERFLGAKSLNCENQ